jgi:hypothetical protein
MVNVVVLAGTVAADPVERRRPSGDEVPVVLTASVGTDRLAPTDRPRASPTIVCKRMPLIGREHVFPLFAQVQLGDPLAGDYPEWETGEERVVFTDQVVAVATQGDEEGDVQVEVWTEPMQDDFGVPILETEVQLTSDALRFGNVIANDVHDVHLPRGWFRVRVLVAPSEGPPSLVRFVLKPSLTKPFRAH